MADAKVFEITWHEHVAGLSVWANLAGDHIKPRIHKAIAAQGLAGGASIVRVNLWWSPLGHDLYLLNSPIFHPAQEVLLDDAA